MSHTDKDLPIQPKVLSAAVTQAGAAHDPYQAFRFRDFRFLLFGTLVGVIGEQMFTYAIGWELYERTNSPLALGSVGLVQVLPVFFLTLPAGHMADMFNRRRIVLITQISLFLSMLTLAWLSFTHGPLPLVYGCLLLIGIIIAFLNPASSALLAQTVPESAFENAATWNSSSWQLASVIGPALGGVLVAVFKGASFVYVVVACTALLFLIAVAYIRETQGEQRRVSSDMTLRSLMEGISFLRRTQVILAAITLDMFGVLLGGATALLPVFAKDILHVGPLELGWLRAAPSLGAVCVAFVLAHRRPFTHAGRTLILVVIGFGLATIGFGLSRFFWLSILFLFLLGGLDNVSVVIRSSLLLLRTPDTMRGRVSAINTLFLGASNELGWFESGLTAQLFGPTISVVGGGIGTILVVLIVALLAPQLRNLKALRNMGE